MEAQEIVNRVATSGLISFDLEQIYPEGERVLLDIKDQLYQGMILREKDFRDYVKNNDWSQYSGKNVAVTCSEDAIIPTWAYMLLAIKLQPFARFVCFGSLQELENALWQQTLATLDISQYENQRVVIKGCSNKEVPVFAYTELTRLLRPIVQNIMFGEPCSTVPLYKKQKEI